MRIKNNQAILNAPFGSILLTFADGDLIKCELSEAAVEEDLGSFVGHKAVKALQSYLKGDIHVLMTWNPPPALSGRMDLSKSTKEEKFHAKKKNTRKKH